MFYLREINKNKMNEDAKKSIMRKTEIFFADEGKIRNERKKLTQDRERIF